MTGRRIDAFFYGLFMDVDVQREAGVAPLDPRRAFDGFALRIGQRATLGPSAGARAYGMLFALTHSEIERLYAGPGLDQYRPEAVLARSLEGAPAPALCFNLREAPRPDERSGHGRGRAARWRSHVRPRLPHRLSRQPPLLAAAAARLMRDPWADRRAGG